MLEILGEAARRMSDDFRQAHPEIPWSDIIGQRNVIAHQYDNIELEQLWSVVTSDIATLITQLEPLISSLTPEIK
ncbi:MAG: DUF86 domain-containing protein [Coleofasciculus sp. G3-WIS-01]|uniref:HepT-like ribonuclease domain-containing protein n=1 Tax=Coleofasciculus sp. G3-WIS-01 TaxID=3069528 RepID=UPI0032F351F0